MKLTVSVPATTANVGPGFDIWGISLNLRNRFSVTIHQNETSGDTMPHPVEFNYHGYAKQTTSGSLETGKKSLLYRCFEKVFKAAALPLPEFSFSADIEIPPVRGLGSSSTATLGAMVLANETIRRLHGQAFSIDQIFNMAVKHEGHPDNIAPALYGGFIVSLYDEINEVFLTHKLQINAPIKLAGLIPHWQLSTNLARKAVAKKIELDTWAFQGSRMALLTDLFAKKNWQQSDMAMFETALQDRIHQNARARYIDGMFETFEYWLNQGALGCYLSGAGTTLLAFWPKEQQLSDEMLTASMAKLNLQASAIQPALDHEGTFLQQES